VTAPDQTVIHVRGMTCGNCVHHVEQALRAVAGVTAVAVDLATGAVRISHGPTLDLTAVLTAIDDAGYSTGAPA